MAYRKPLSKILGGVTRFGRLTVIGDAPSKIAASGFEARCARVRCDCGIEKDVRAGDLRNGYANSCGCLQRELVADASKTRNATHGGCRRDNRSPEYTVWTGLLQRCHNPNDKNFSRYGGRGISVCARWRGENGFPNFIADMGPRPTGLTLERMNNDGPYSPDNCAWATLKRQCNNRRSNRILEARGRAQTVTQWARELGINPSVIFCRLRSGWAVEAAIFTPKRDKRQNRKP